MTYSLTPVEVAPYSIDFVSNVIRHITKWASLGEVGDKAHLAYLDNYLKALNVETVVLESEYIDRHYLEDYSEYYARCFQPLPKNCARLHFFTTKFFEEDFIEAIDKNKKRFIDKNILSQDAYIGFVVIKPLPVTCIARMCLRPYEFDESAIVLHKKVTVSLCGIKLQLRTAAFVEQDKVVSACATSAVWALLNASDAFGSDLPPSPSAITKSALETDANGARIFPAAAGLRVEHVCRALKAYGFEPTVIDQATYDCTDEAFLERTKQILAAYIPADIPVLIGGTVTTINDGGKEEEQGEHLVCAMGYRANNDLTICSPGRIGRVYVHDDRYGPYVSLAAESNSFGAFNFELRQSQQDKTEKLIRKERFVPKVLIMGMYHKVRIDFDYVYNVATVLRTLVKEASEHHDGLIKEFDEFLSCQFHASLCLSSTLKAKILNEANGTFSFNGTKDKSEILFRNFPKYLWCIRFTKDNAVFIDIFFDATGVPQGDLIIGGAAHTTTADLFWKSLANFATSPLYRLKVSKLEPPSNQSFTNCITRFFSNKEDAYLDSLYGRLRLPSRKFRDSELENNGDQKKRPTGMIKKIVRGTDALPFVEKLNSEAKYIWAIDRQGDFIFGEEDRNRDKAMGHPSLTEGGTARLAGELEFHQKRKRWEINVDSGAYSAHLKQAAGKARTYMRSVITHNLKGCKIFIAKPQEASKTPTDAYDSQKPGGSSALQAKGTSKTEK